VEGEAATYCGKHRKDGMVNVRSLRCAEAGCTVRPKFGVEGEAATHCALHAPKSTRNVVSPRCLTCRYFTVPRIGQQCRSCSGYTATIKRVEHEIRDMIEGDESLRHYTTWDRVHPCAKTVGARQLRPDSVWQLKDRAVIMEVDEHAHRLYEARCEATRLHELHLTFDGPLTVLRYNPHANWDKLRGRPAGKRERPHAILIDLLHEVIEDGTVAERGDMIVQRGDPETILIIYAGYPGQRIDKLDATVADMYEEAGAAGGAGAPMDDD